MPEVTDQSNPLLPASEAGEAEEEKNVAAFLANSQDPAAVSPEAPVPAAPEEPMSTGIDALRQQITKEVAASLHQTLDTRVAGFQRMVAERDRQITEQATQLREFQVAGLSEDERDQLAQSERDEEIESLRFDNQLLSLQTERPKEVSVLRQLYAASDAIGQLAIITELLTGAQAPLASAGGPTVPVDRNNPQLRIPDDAIVTEDGQIMSEAIAMATLRRGEGYGRG